LWSCPSCSIHSHQNSTDCVFPHGHHLPYLPDSIVWQTLGDNAGIQCKVNICQDESQQ
jgi:hypothetical protein